MGKLSVAGGVTASLVRTALARLRRGPFHRDWSLFTEAVFAYLRRTGRGLAALDPAGQRARFEAMVLRSPALKKVRITPLEPPAPRGEWLEPARGAAGRTVLYLHGGGYVTGSLRSHEEMAAHLALESSARVLL